MTLCLNGYKLYSEVWNDQPPLRTFLITQAVRLQGNQPTPSLSPSDSGTGVSPVRIETDGRVRGAEDRQDALSHYSPLGPRLVTVAFAALLLISVFIMALHVARQSGAGVSPAWAEGEAGRERTRGTQSEGESVPSLRSVRSFAARLWTAGLATALLIASPGFLELSSSCMLEIPALATALAGLCALWVLPRTRWFAVECLAGILFGSAALMKLVPLYLLPLAAMIVWLRQRDDQSETMPSLSPSPSPRPFPQPTGRGWSLDRVRGSSTSPSLSAVLQSLGRLFVPMLVMGAALAASFVAVDWLIERGAFLIHFQQSWSSHFGGVQSFEYGSPGEHAFDWSILPKNWDLALPAALGICVLITRLREMREAIQL